MNRCVWLAHAVLWVCSVLTGQASAQVYKWVDEQGVTHYAERPPQGRKARPLDTTSPTGPGSSQVKPQTSQDWQDKNIEFQKRRIQREQQAEREQNEAKQRRLRCNVERDRLRQMESAHRLYDLNEKGERVYLGGSEHQAAIEDQRQFVARNCPR